MEYLKTFYIWLGIGEKYREWEGIDYFIAILASLMILLIFGLIIFGIYYLINGIGARWYEFSGKLEGKQYEPSTRSTNVGFVANGDGGMSPMVSSSGHAESFDIFVRLPDKSIQKLYVDQQRYFDLNTGDTIIFWKQKGRISKDWIDETTIQPRRNLAK